MALQSKLSSLAPLVIAMALLAAIVAFVYFQLAFLWVEEKSALSPIENTTPSSSHQSNEKNHNVSSFSLFGKVGQKAEPVSEEPKNLPKTKLKLTLTGVATGETEKTGSALIQEPSKTTQRYRVGDQLPGNAELHAVYEQHVVLLRNGIKETLEFPRASSSTAQILAREREKNVVTYKDDVEERSTPQIGTVSTTPSSVEERRNLGEDAARKQQITERLKSIRKRAMMGQ